MRIFKKVEDGVIVGVAGVDQGEGWEIADTEDADIIDFMNSSDYLPPSMVE